MRFCLTDSDSCGSNVEKKNNNVEGQRESYEEEDENFFQMLYAFHSTLNYVSVYNLFFPYPIPTIQNLCRS